MRQLSLILLLCMAAILDHALALRRIKRNDADTATNHTLIAQDFVKLQIEEPLEVATKKGMSGAAATVSDNVSAPATAAGTANAIVESTGSSRNGSPNAAHHATSEQMNNYSCPKQTVDVTHFEPLESASYAQSQYTPTNSNASAYAPASSSEPNISPAFQVNVPVLPSALKTQLELSRLLKEKKLQTAQQHQQQQEQQEDALSSSCSLKKAAKPGISFLLGDHVPNKLREHLFENNGRDAVFGKGPTNTGDDAKKLLTRAGVSSAAGSSGSQLQPLLGERSHFKHFGGNLQNKGPNNIDCNIRNYAANNYDSANNNADNMSNNNNNKVNNVVANNVDKSNGNAGHNENKNSNNNNNDKSNSNNNNNNNNGSTKNNNNNNADNNSNRNNINNNKNNNNNDNNKPNNLMNIFDDNVGHNLLQQPEQPQSAASLPAAPYATGTDNKINQFNKQSQQLQQLLYPQVGGSQQLWRANNNKFAPMENVMKFANMLLYKVGLDSSPFHAQGAQFVVNPNLSPNFSPSPSGNLLTTSRSGSLGASNPLDIDDFDTIDYLYNTLDALPSMHPAGSAIATASTSYARPLVFQPQYGANDPSQPFNFFESALDLLLGDEQGEDELEMRCPLHHDKKSTAEGSSSGAADDAKDDLIQVCSCRLIKKKKNA